MSLAPDRRQPAMLVVKMIPLLGNAVGTGGNGTILCVLIFNCNVLVYRYRKPTNIRLADQFLSVKKAGKCAFCEQALKIGG
ncbi:hypothetical protein C5188_20045 [Serratia liquefaciens]|uniref:Uncharacterized protein n=1 Tax=Serratia liquefaciens TaxID=614 RepID=A0A515D243_SERLI|nr:hypothetical protein C5188_20045 [Serratia liquefaciens]QDL34479.1 hypothetical protein EGO53_23065 [Serratia liquefaciens]RYM70438.1 hypothetical protein BSQ99_15010 [Serratia liquefaciens]